MLAAELSRWWRRIRRALRPAPLGAKGERIAADFLRSRGYRVLGRNVRVRAGEADIVCEPAEGGPIVIVEVKTRALREGAPELSNTTLPEAAITLHKRKKLLQVASALSRANNWQNRHVRIDVIAVEWHETEGPSLRHHVNAVGV